MVEQIAGIKNYIHDFGLLSEKDKEYVVLWNDFLIYVVLLEENESVYTGITKGGIEIKKCIDKGEVRC